MKRILYLLILGISINASAQVSISTRADSIKAINDRQITTSVPPNLVYPVQVGAKTDSLCALIKSFVDTVNAITSTTLGLQQVTSNLDTTNLNMTVGDGTYYTVHSPIGITTVKKSGNVVASYLGYGSGKNYVYLKDPASSNGFFINSGNLTGLRYGYLPDEGTSGGGIRSSFMLHYTVHPLTIDLAGTGDSTVLGPGSLNVYGPPTFTYNSYGYFTPYALFFGEINTAHTHVDGLNVGFTTDGYSYHQYFQNDTGAIALVHNITSFTPTLTATYIGVGNGSNQLSGSSDATYDGATFNLSPSGVRSLTLKEAAFNVGDIAGATNSGKLVVGWSGTYPVVTIDDATGGYFVVNPNTGVYGLGDGVDGLTPIGNGTRCSIDDNAGVMSITNGFALTGIRTSTGSTTMINGSAGLYCDPATIAATATINLPPSPTDGQEITIYFGGTITSGTVVTALTINPGANTMLATMPVSATTNTVIRLKYRLSNTSWYPN